MATQSQALAHGLSARATFYVVRQSSLAELTDFVTVLPAVPHGGEELGAFGSANGAIDFAEAAVQELNRSGPSVEMVDPPHGLVGAG